MNYCNSHKTIYEYAAPVAVSHHVARLEPRATSAQTPENFALKIFPQPVLRKARADYFGNQLCFFSIQENHQRLEITAASRVSIRKIEPPAVVLEPNGLPMRVHELADDVLDVSRRIKRSDFFCENRAPRNDFAHCADPVSMMPPLRREPTRHRGTDEKALVVGDGVEDVLHGGGDQDLDADFIHGRMLRNLVGK